MVSGHERGNIECSDVGGSALFCVDLDEIPKTKWKRRLSCAAELRSLIASRRGPKPVA
jgi:hypothetical protein